MTSGTDRAPVFEETRRAEMRSRPEAALATTVWSKIISQLFFCFFTSPILSPAINDKALYLNWVVPLFDLEFLRFIHRMAARVPGELLAASAALIAWFAVLAPEMALRWILILWPLLYLKFAYEAGIFYLYRWMGINIGVALAQAVTYYVAGQGTAMLIGPNNISKVIWGPYATRTFTNFYSIVPGLDFPRFSGLSREGGFFAALLAVVLLFRRADKGSIGVLLWLGVALSISKVTLFLAAGWLIMLVGLRDRRSPAILFLPFFVAFLLVYYVFVDPQFLSGELSSTFTQRFYPYSALIHDFDWGNILVGNKAAATVLEQFQSFQVCAAVDNFKNCLETPTFIALIYAGGIVGLGLYLWQLAAIGIKLWGVLLLFVLTSNVSPFTDSSFVVLCYFLAILIGKSDAADPMARNNGFTLVSGAAP